MLVAIERDCQAKMPKTALARGKSAQNENGDEKR
jgi:hypothetical protein